MESPQSINAINLRAAPSPRIWGVRARAWVTRPQLVRSA